MTIRSFDRNSRYGLLKAEATERRAGEHGHVALVAHAASSERRGAGEARLHGDKKVALSVGIPCHAAGQLLQTAGSASIFALEPVQRIQRVAVRGMPLDVRVPQVQLLRRAAEEEGVEGEESIEQPLRPRAHLNCIRLMTVRSLSC